MDDTVRGRPREKAYRVSESHSVLCDPMACSLPGSSVHGILQARIWSGLPFPSPGDLPNPGIEPESSALQADSLPLSHLGSLSFSLPLKFSFSHSAKLLKLIVSFSLILLMSEIQNPMAFPIIFLISKQLRKLFFWFFTMVHDPNSFNEILSF